MAADVKDMVPSGDNVKETPEFSFTYLFLPFRIRNGAFDEFNKALTGTDDNGRWAKADYNPGYMFRFVTNKIDGTDGENRCCHYVLKPEYNEHFEKTVVAFPKSKVSASEAENGRYELRLGEYELFCFSTGVCLFVIRANTDGCDTDALINASYNMKYVSKTLYHITDPETGAVDRRAKPFTLLSSAEAQFSELPEDLGIDFFYYANKDKQGKSHVSRIAFMLTYVYRNSAYDYHRDLYYLRNAYSLKFRLVEENMNKESEVFSVSEYVRWGLTAQSAVCIAMNMNYDNFVEYVLPKNISREYKFMFAYLLHQRCVLYHLMMQIDTGLNNNLQMLEDYKEQLGRFKTYFLFSRISEVPQYQGLYEKVTQAFALYDMFEDVNEPLLMLEESMREKENQRRAEEERLREKRDRTKNLLLAALGLLGIYSAFADAGQFADELNNVIGSFGTDRFGSVALSHIPHLLFYILIIVLIVFIAVNYFRNDEKDGEKNKDGK